MWVAAQSLGAPDAAEAEVRALAFGAGVAAFLRAVPALADAGRIPLIDGTHDGLRALATRARQRLSRPRVPSSVRPALWPAVGASATLQRVERDPSAVGDGRLPEAVPSARLTATVLTGRLWL